MSISILDESRRPIGIFDSGIGGLTVVKEINKLLPNEKIIYFGDTARVPYGNKSRETVIDYSLQITYFLMKKKIKMLIVACNTASSVSLPTLRRHFHIPIIGVIEPGSKAAVRISINKEIGIIGTHGTVNSGSYAKTLRKLNKSIRLKQKACPLFVQLAEDGWTENHIAQLIADEYLKDILKNKIDTLILGCTHYPLLKKVIRRSVGNEITLIDSGIETARETKRILENKNLLNMHKLNPREHSVYYVSDFPHRFRELSKRFLGQELKYIHKIKLAGK
jgi:glutamate racemase